MGQGQAAKGIASTAGDGNAELAAIGRGALTLDETAILEAIDQADHRVMTQDESLGQRTNRGRSPFRQSA